MHRFPTLRGRCYGWPDGDGAPNIGGGAGKLEDGDVLGGAKLGSRDPCTFGSCGRSPVVVLDASGVDEARPGDDISMGVGPSTLPGGTAGALVAEEEEAGPVPSCSFKLIGICRPLAAP